MRRSGDHGPKGREKVVGQMFRRTRRVAKSSEKARGPRFKLVRYLAATSAGAFVLVAGALAWLAHQQGAFFHQVQEEQSRFVRQIQEQLVRQQGEAARQELLAVQERAHFALGRMFASTLWERELGPLLARAETVSLEACRAAAEADKKLCAAMARREIAALPGYDALNAKVLEALKKTGVLSLSVQDLRGITVYASEPQRLAEERSGEAGWQSALRGSAASQYTHRDQITAPEGVLRDRELIHSFIPVAASGSDAIAAVLEVASDAGRLLGHIQATGDALSTAAAGNQARLEEARTRNEERAQTMSTLGSLVVVGALAFLFLVLFLIGRRAERNLLQQETERENAQRQLAQSEKMASLGQMVAGVAHQLNTPLAFSHNNVSLVMQQLEQMEKPLRLGTKLAQLARRATGDRVVLNLQQVRPQLDGCEADPQDVPMMRDMLGDVLHGIEQMSEMVVNMRDFTRLDRANVGEYDLNKGLKTVAYVARSAIPNGIQIVEQYGPVPPILCTPSQLNQVFLNLINNAAQAIREIGKVTLRTRVEGARVRVDVEDDGAGIPSDVLPQIFESYFTTKPEGVGTGLGLSIARDIVRQHGGDIEVKTKLGKGTTFTVWLPLQGAEPALAKAA